ncbi:MAG TPA: SLBB domain-containing protein [Spirochaetia bacterium]|nr:SLBB domain-containing protein [Spirochaetia bacterium]
MRRIGYAICLLALSATSALCQEVQSATAGNREAEERVRLATSSIDYPVTPGDVYRLTYSQTADTPITADLFVDGTSTIDFGIFGKIVAVGMRFVDLKQEVEKLIAKSYSRSMPSLRILTPGSFQVSVTGEVDHIQYLSAWGLTKLSEIFQSARGEYSSMRIVEVRSRTGESKRYDLLMATRLGVLSQDPDVRPGDTIVLVPARRTVELTGQVRHPGRYELLPGEGLRELVESFGGGTTIDADTARVRIDRSAALRIRSEYVALPAAYAATGRLEDGDSVVIPSRSDRQAVVWFSGAVATERLSRTEAGQPASPDGNATAAAPRPTPGGGAGATANIADAGYVAAARIAIPVRDGQMLSDTLFEVRAALLPSADLSSATLYRHSSGTSISVNLNPLLTEANPLFDVALQPNDEIFIPFRRASVSVSGAVIVPGFFQYEPNLSALAYVNMAGGVDPERSANGSYWVASSEGKKRNSSDPVMPGDRIYVPLNSPGYQFERTMPVLAAVITAILNAVTVVLLLTR